MKLKDNILANIEKLPENLQVEILHYSEYLLNNYAQENQEKTIKSKRGGIGILKGKISMSDDSDEMLPKKEDDQRYGYGSLAGKIIMSEDFDEPLEDLAEYM